MATAFLAEERVAATDPSLRESSAFTAIAHVLFAAKEFIYLR
jgi:hypothetical protein